MILEVDGVEFGYDSVATISGIRFSAGAGDMVSVIGPNGVGKTTLLKCINRVHRMDAGTVLVDGSDVHDMARKEMAKRIGYVPQRAMCREHGLRVGPARPETAMTGTSRRWPSVGGQDNQDRG
jgi:ABC-type cobalamin/Fe3+-siderophores transport system ATPase subunit